MALDSLHRLFVDELRDLYDAEHRLNEALPKMARAASSPDLTQAFQEHMETTTKQIERLHKVFGHLNMDPSGRTCKGMQGIIQEGEDIIKMSGDPDVKDAALISAAQKAEHYEISAYGTARAFAKQLGYNDIVNVLDQTIDEEGKTDKRLTKLAQGNLMSPGINRQAQTRA